MIHDFFGKAKATTCTLVIIDLPLPPLQSRSIPHHHAHHLKTNSYFCTNLPMNRGMNIEQLAKETKRAAIQLAAIDSQTKNRALEGVAQALSSRRNDILAANQLDIRISQEANLAAPLLKRLLFDEAKLNDAIEGVRSLIRLPEPVGVTQSAMELDRGLELYRVSCPIGVIGVIFESRPDALVQISTLCLKSGNGVLLKGGSEAMNTNRVLAETIAQASAGAGIPEGWVQLLETRADVNQMLRMDGFIDLIIPRGSNEFVKYIMDNSNIPVLGHADGICHVYADRDADLDMALELIFDSKTQYVAVCNAAETLLVHSHIAKELLPALKVKLDAKSVELVGCERTRAVVPATPATPDSWRTEYLDYRMSVRIVDSLQEAIDHINTYGSGHTDAIITSSKEAAATFISLVDTGNAFWNCSTRFSDGFRYGLGAEVGISTNKIHARGPVGLEGLLIYKWIAKGNGHTVAPYSSGKKKFTHNKLNKKFDM